MNTILIVASSFLFLIGSVGLAMGLKQHLSPWYIVVGVAWIVVFVGKGLIKRIEKDQGEQELTPEFKLTYKRLEPQIDKQLGYEIQFHNISEDIFIEEVEIQADMIGGRLIQASKTHWDGIDEFLPIDYKPWFRIFSAKRRTAHRVRAKIRLKGIGPGGGARWVLTSVYNAGAFSVRTAMDDTASVRVRWTQTGTTKESKLRVRATNTPGYTKYVLRKQMEKVLPEWLFGSKDGHRVSDFRSPCREQP